VAIAAQGPSTRLLECGGGAPTAGPAPSWRWCTYRFDPFTLDTRTRQLLRDGEEVHLSPKAFDLLLSLIENRTRAMSRSELHKQLWPSTFVLDTNLASLVAEIRRALGDTADDPRFVRTMHRFGYWFISSVHEESSSGEPAQSPLRHWLVWETRQVPLNPGENIVGRAPDAAVWIDAAGVSRHHARITVAGDEATVEDLGSKNGTFVRGEPITHPQRLADGDQIRLGSVVITFRIPAHVGTTETVHSR
jgi:DNA-binding winged helix-turn-helix (wHTH) protein